MALLVTVRHWRHAECSHVWLQGTTVAGQRYAAPTCGGVRVGVAEAARSLLGAGVRATRVVRDRRVYTASPQKGHSSACSSEKLLPQWLHVLWAMGLTLVLHSRSPPDVV